MKKIMLSTVILLPIIVLLVLLVSSSIIGSTAHIYVDNIAFADGTDVIELKLEFPLENAVPSIKVTDDGMFIVVNCAQFTIAFEGKVCIPSGNTNEVIETELNA